ncbi:MAG TPA: arylsulfatase [Pirellulales bacterium]|nr:arylsulfatase [Pirellulales bacterium]
MANDERSMGWFPSSFTASAVTNRPAIVTIGGMISIYRNRLVWLCRFTCLLAAVATTCTGPAFADIAGRRPNIILIVSDDQGYGDLGRNGNAVVRTPNLDRMHDESVRFEDFHVSPTCAPTRASLMTGRHEFKNGVTHTILERERLNLQATTIAQVLRAAGYRTGIFGKWHLGDEPPYQPGRRGFEETFIHGAGGIGQSYEGTCGDAPNNSYFNPVILHNGIFEKTSGYCTDVFFWQASKWIENTKGAAPFFCYIPTNAPHAPLDVPPQYEQIYAGKGTRPEVARFLGMVTNLDENVGKLLARLGEWGIERETLVIFMNDNGGTAGCDLFNAGMRGRKGTARNGGARAMSLWRWPGTLRPAAVTALTAHLDLFPTFAELAGATLPDYLARRLDGFSLVPLLEHPAAVWHDDRMLFTHVGRWKAGAAPEKFGPCSVRWRQYLMVRQGEQWTLYDLKSDPSETTDLAEQQPAVVNELATAYDRWWEEVLPCLVNEDAYKAAAKKVNPFKELYRKQFGDQR